MRVLVFLIYIPCSVTRVCCHKLRFFGVKLIILYYYLCIRKYYVRLFYKFDQIKFNTFTLTWAQKKT